MERCNPTPDCPLLEYNPFDARRLVSPEGGHWSFNGLLKRPAKPHSVIDCAEYFIVLPTPLRGSFSYTVNSFKSGHTSVRRLFSLCSPTTIRRLVVSISVNSIDRVFGRRLFTHILNKVNKSCLGIVPSIANFDTPSTINMKVVIVRILAPLSHCSPRIIFRLINRVPTMPIITIFTTLIPSLTARTSPAAHRFKTTLVSFKNMATSTLYPVSTPTESLYDSKCTLVNVYHNNIITQRWFV